MSFYVTAAIVVILSVSGFLVFRPLRHPKNEDTGSDLLGQDSCRYRMFLSDRTGKRAMVYAEIRSNELDRLAAWQYSFASRTNLRFTFKQLVYQVIHAHQMRIMERLPVDVPYSLKDSIEDQVQDRIRALIMASDYAKSAPRTHELNLNVRLRIYGLANPETAA